MYTTALLLHSWLRWLVLGLGVALLTTAVAYSRGGREWSDAIERLRKGFLGGLDVQVLLGLVLFGLLSPITRAGMADIAAAMADSARRFYLVEHVFGMLLGVVVAHVGLARAKRVSAETRPRAVWITMALWLVITLASIPWPGLPYGRPLFRLFFLNVP